MDTKQPVQKVTTTTTQTVQKIQRDPAEIAQEEIANKMQVVHKLIQESHVGWEYILMLSIACLVTTLGLLVGSASVVIGGMLLAPLMSPILALGLGFITANQQSVMRALINIGKSIALILGLSTVTAFIFGGSDPFNNLEIISRTQPLPLFIFIAILSGIAAAFAWAKPNLSASLPGIAVAVALVPPLCVTGIGIAAFSREIVVGSLQLFLINLAGIATSSAIVFSLLGFYQMKFVEQKEITTEKIADEKKRQEKEAQKSQ